MGIEGRLITEQIGLSHGLSAPSKSHCGTASFLVAPGNIHHDIARSTEPLNLTILRTLSTSLISSQLLIL